MGLTQVWGCEHDPLKVRMCCKKCADESTRNLRAQLREVNEKNSELIVREGKAWGIQFCCNGHECGCQGAPIDPPHWWFDMQEQITALEEKLREAEGERGRLRGLATTPSPPAPERFKSLHEMRAWAAGWMEFRRQIAHPPLSPPPEAEEETKDG